MCYCSALAAPPLANPAIFPRSAARAERVNASAARGERRSRPGMHSPKWGKACLARCQHLGGTWRTLVRSKDPAHELCYCSALAAPPLANPAIFSLSAAHAERVNASAARGARRSRPGMHPPKWGKARLARCQHLGGTWRTLVRGKDPAHELCYCSALAAPPLANPAIFPRSAAHAERVNASAARGARRSRPGMHPPKWGKTCLARCKHLGGTWEQQLAAAGRSSGSQQTVKRRTLKGIEEGSLLHTRVYHVPPRSWHLPGAPNPTSMFQGHCIPGVQTKPNLGFGVRNFLKMHPGIGIWRNGSGLARRPIPGRMCQGTTIFLHPNKGNLGFGSATFSKCMWIFLMCHNDFFLCRKPGK